MICSTFVLIIQATIREIFEIIWDLNYTVIKRCLSFCASQKIWFRDEKPEDVEWSVSNRSLITPTLTLPWRKFAERGFRKNWLYSVYTAKVIQTGKIKTKSLLNILSVFYYESRLWSSHSYAFSFHKKYFNREFSPFLFST